MTLAGLVVEIRASAEWLGGRIDEPDPQALVNRLVARAGHGSPLAVARQQPLEQILDALRAPERAIELPRRMTGVPPRQGRFVGAEEKAQVSAASGQSQMQQTAGWRGRQPVCPI